MLAEDGHRPRSVIRLWTDAPIDRRIRAACRCRVRHERAVQNDRFWRPAAAKSASVPGRSVTRRPSRLATTRPSRRHPARQRRIGRAGNSWLGVAAWLDEYGVPGDAASTAAWIDWPAARWPWPRPTGPGSPVPRRPPRQRPQQLAHRLRRPLQPPFIGGLPSLARSPGPSAWPGSGSRGFGP